MSCTPNTIHRIQDNFGRHFPYLRLSITDVCNFACSYCLPNGYKPNGCTPFMTQSEILRLVRGFAHLGVTKVRLTGGEPTVRQDFLTIAEHIAHTPGIQRLVMTTNGYKLNERARSFYDAGIRALNISIDSLNPQTFKTITGHDRLGEILTGIDTCFEVGFKTIKVNAVLLKDLNYRELNDFIAFTKDCPISLRFIELMRTNDNQAYFNAHHIPAFTITDRLIADGWTLKHRPLDAGPAQEFIHPDFQGSMGVIAPYSPDFCKSCNRLRVSATGDLHLCLFGEKGYPLRKLLQSDSTQYALESAILDAMNYKRSTHFLHSNNSGIRNHLASIGG